MFGMVLYPTNEIYKNFSDLDEGDFFTVYNGNTGTDELYIKIHRTDEFKNALSFSALKNVFVSPDR